MEKKSFFIDNISNRYNLGYIIGKKTKNLIKKSIFFYKNLVKYNDNKGIIIDYLKKLNNKLINDFKGAYEEIKGLSDGSEIDLNDILFINARSEIFNFILNSKNTNECSVISCNNYHYLSQNWDFYENVREFCYYEYIEDKQGFRLFQIKEAGIIGKIGINSFGIGTTLTFVNSKSKKIDIPIHILLREILLLPDLSQICTFIENYGEGKSGSIIVQDKNKAVLYEFANDKVYKKELNDLTFHTNHFILIKNGNKDDTKFMKASTVLRYKKLEEFFKNKHCKGFEDCFKYATKILSYTSESEDALNRHLFDKDENLYIVTLSSIHYDLKNKKVYYTIGQNIQGFNFNSLTL